MPTVLITGASGGLGQALARRWLFQHPTLGEMTMIDIYAVSAIILHWTVLFTAAIAAFIVMVMKGPAYVADAYPLDDSDAPPCKR